MFWKRALPLLAAALGCASCGDATKTQAKTSSAKSAPDGRNEKPHAHGHEHNAPHGGTLVALGEHLAHLEFVLDAAGKISVYVLDGEAEKAVRLKHEHMELKVTPVKGDPFQVMLKAVANHLTGEKGGDSSQFEAQDDRLKGLKEFDGIAPQLEVKGVTVKPTRFHFPKGNEHEGHDHAHDHH